MDDDRRHFLAYEIISGLKFITIQGVRYTLVAPSARLRLLAEHIYQETTDALRFDNLITQEKALLILRSLNIWNPENEESLKKLEKHLEDKKVELYKALYDSDRQGRIRQTITYAKKAIHNALSKKHSLDYMTLNYHASLTKKKFIIAMCLRDEKDQRAYNEQTFWSADSTILEEAMDYLDSTILPIEGFRELARNNPWRTMWSLGKESCFSSSPSAWSDDQQTLVTFTKMYDNAYQSLECPPESVFEDDDMFDGWMLDQRRTREKDQKQKQVDTMKNVPEGAQEVFVFAPNREDANKVYDLNDPDSRRKIQQRQKMIEARGSVDAKDLPDTQMELRKQQMDEYKSKMQRG